jgi:hypothetical protein
MGGSDSGGLDLISGGELASEVLSPIDTSWKSKVPKLSHIEIKLHLWISWPCICGESLQERSISLWQTGSAVSIYLR